MAKYCVFDTTTGEISQTIQSREEAYYVASGYPGQGVIEFTGRVTPATYYVVDPGTTPVLTVRPALSVVVEDTVPVLDTETLLYSSVPSGTTMSDASGLAVLDSMAGEVLVTAPAGVHKLRIRLSNFPAQDLVFAWDGVL